MRALRKLECAITQVARNANALTTIAEGTAVRSPLELVLTMSGPNTASSRHLPSQAASQDAPGGGIRTGAYSRCRDLLKAGAAGLPRPGESVTLCTNLRRPTLFALLTAVLAGVAFAGVASGGRAHTLDTQFDGTWQSTRGEMIIRAANDFVDFGEYGDNMIGRLCGIHVFEDDGVTLDLAGWWYEGGPTFALSSDGTDCGDIKSAPWGRFWFKAGPGDKTLIGKFETHGDGLPLGNSDKWPAWTATRVGSSSGGGSTGGRAVTKLATGSAPFGTPVTGTVPVGQAIDIPSPKLPPLTSEVDASAALSGAEIEEMLAALPLKSVGVIGGKRRTFESLSSYCLLFIPVGGSAAIGSDYASVPNQCDRLASILSQNGKDRYLSALRAGCSAVFVPFWKPGSRVTVAQHNAAVAAAKSEVQASCTGTRTGKLAFKIVAKGKTTLNQVLGKNAPAAIGSGGPAGKAQLAVTWAQPKTRATSGPPGKATPGHYAGTTNASGSIAFDVTTGGTAVTNLTVVGPVDCTDTTSWTWTISSAGTTAITASRTFTRSYNGGLTISSSTYSNIKVAYTLSGTLTSTGSASGKFQVTSMSWDASGKHYTCTGALTSWTARIGG